MLPRDAFVHMQARAELELCKQRHRQEINAVRMSWSKRCTHPARATSFQLLPHRLPHMHTRKINVKNNAHITLKHCRQMVRPSSLQHETWAM